MEKQTIKLPKVIGKFTMRSMTVRGDRCKTIGYVHENGVTNLHQYILSKEESLLNFEKVCSKFGWHLHSKWYGLKYTTLIQISKTVTEILKENNVKPETILK